MKKFRKMMSVLIGFITIGLLSSVLAKIQGMIFPTSLEIFNTVHSASLYFTQLTLKFFCVLLSCVFGGMMTTRIGGEKRENLIVGGLIILVVGWLWVSVLHPIWFWLLLMLFVLPAVFLGGRITDFFKK